MYKSLTHTQYCRLESLYRRFRRAGVPKRVKNKLAREFNVNVVRICEWFSMREQKAKLRPQVTNHIIIK